MLLMLQQKAPFIFFHLTTYSMKAWDLVIASVTLAILVFGVYFTIQCTQIALY